MELPFAVGSSGELPTHHSDDGSLVTASSQGDSTILQPYDTGAPESFASSFLPSRIISAVSQWNNNGASQLSQQQQSQPAAKLPSTAEMNDYTYVNVWETDEVDIVLSNHEEIPTSKEIIEAAPKDILALLLNPTASTELTLLIKQANEAVSQAKASKNRGDLVTAVQYQSQAAHAYYQAAMNCRQDGYGELPDYWLVFAPCVQTE